MKKLLLTLSLFLVFSSSNGQNFIDWAKESVIQKLISYGFDTTTIKHSIKESRDLIKASIVGDSINLNFNYYLDTSDVWNSCDSVVLNYYCSKCFTSNLSTILFKEKKKWKKVSDTVFVNIVKPGKTTFFDKSKRPEYLIEKLKIKEDKTTKLKSIHIFHIKVSEEEYLKYKKLKNYR
jgi:hypothetical protein